MSESRPGKYKVLLAVSQSAQVAVLAALLTEQGYEVQAVRSGRAALEAVQRASPDLVVLGTPLPDMDSFKLCERLRADERTRNTPVVCVIPQGEPDIRSKVFAAGGADYVARPLEGEEVLARVRGQLTLRAVQEQLAEQDAQLEHARAQSERDAGERRQKRTSSQPASEGGYGSGVSGASADANDDRRVQEGELLSAILDTVGALVVVLDPRGRIVGFNQACERTTGYSAEEVLSQCFWDLLLTPEEVEPVKAVFSELRAGAFPNEYENFWVTKEGDCRLITWSNTALLNGDGEVAYVIGTGIDITERRQAEEAVRESEEHFRDLYENAPNVYFSVGVDGRIRRCNRRVVQLLGYAAEELVGRPVLDVYANTLHGREKAEKVLQRFRAGEIVRDEELQMQKADGTPVWISLTVNVVPDAQGRVVESRSMIVDITDRKQADEALREQLRRNEQMLQTTMDGYILADTEGKLTDVNPAYCEMIGYSREELLRMNIHQLEVQLPPEEIEQRIEQMVREGAARFETKHKREDGRVIDLEVSYTIMQPEAEPLVAAFVRDITDRKRAKEALTRSEERYALAERAANVGSWDWDTRTGDLHWSDQIESMFGFAHGEFGGTYQAFLQCVHPEDRQHVVDAVNASVEGGADYAIEHRIVWPDGTVRWVSEAGDVIRDESGRALRMLGVVQDITERKQAEEQIRQQNEFLTSVLESVTHPLYVVDVADHSVTMANSAAFSGSPPEHATCYALFHGRSRPCVETGQECPIEEIKRTKKPVTAEHIHHDVDGDRRITEVRGYPLLDDEGEVTAVIEYCLDVTERKQMEKALRAAKDAAEEARREEQRRRREADRRRQIAERLADVLAALNSNQPLDQVLDYIAEQASELLNAQAVAICRLRGDAETFSVEAARCLPHNPVSGAGLPAGVEALVRAVALRHAVAVPDLAADPTELAPGAEQPVPDERDAKPFRALLAVPINVQDERYGGMVLYYGHPRSFSDDEIELAAVFGNQIALAVGNARLRDQIQEAAVSAERSRLARDLHDSVTQALFSASLVAETLPRVWERDPQEAQNGLEELRHLTQGALAEMRTLLLELRPTALVETKLDDLLLQLTQAVTSRVQVPVAVNIEPSPTLPSDVHVTFYRVAQEALHNAVKHAEASQLSISLRALSPVSHQEADRWQEQVVLRVSDDGRGFDAGQARGEHLGLSIMRERAQAVGARLTVESQPDHGTQVILVWDGTLPERAGVGSL
jgi:PAS domain S-box-containing protein